MEQEKNTNQVSQQQIQQQQTSVSPTIDVYGSQINRNDFINYINQNTESFFNTYSNMWSNKQKQQLLQQKDALINNIANGNITRIGNNSIDITNIDNSGIDSTQGGAGQIIVGMADKVAQEVHNQLEAAKPHKKWTDSTLQQSWLNYFYGGKDPGNYQSWVDRDIKNDKGKRETTNRVAAIREWLDTINPTDYTSGLDLFGGQEEFANRLNALKQALSDGTIDNNDYTAADRLGFGNELRTLLNDNIISQEDTNNSQNNTNSQEDQPLSDEQVIANAWQGGDPRKVYKEIANTIRNWKQIEYSTRISMPSFMDSFAYLRNRLRTDKSNAFNVHDSNAMQKYYANTFFPNFFKLFSNPKFSPEYLNNHNDLINTWNGQQHVWQYIADNLQLAIRNKRFQNGVLLGNYSKQLNQIINPDGSLSPFWTVPGSFNEQQGTLFIFNPETAEFKRISLLDPKYKYNMQDYLRNKGIDLSTQQDNSTQETASEYKNGGKIDKYQYGGNILEGYYAKPNITTMEQAEFKGLPTAQEIAQQKKLQQQQAQEQARQKQIQAEEQKRTNAANRKVYDNNGIHLDGTDIARLAALGQDVGAFVSSFVGGYGTAASGVLGVTSMLTDLGADISDDQLTAGDVAKNAVVNTGLALVGMIPGGKSASITTKIVKFAPKLLAVWGMERAFKPAADSVKKAVNGQDLTEQDFKNILWGIKSTLATGTIGRNTYKDWKYSGLRNNKINGTKPAPSKYEISVNKNNTQQKVTLSHEQYSALNKAKTQTEANAKLRQYLANNGEQEADKFSFRDGLFPEKASKNPFNRNKDILGGKEIPQANNIQGRDVYQRANDLRKLRNPTLSKYLNTDYDVYVNGKYPIKNINIPFLHFKFKKFQDRYVEPIKPKQTSSVGNNAKSVDTDIPKQTGDIPKPTNDTPVSSTGKNGTQASPTNNLTEGSTFTPQAPTKSSIGTSQQFSQSTLNKIQDIFDADNKTINIDKLDAFRTKYKNLINDRLSSKDKNTLDLLIRGKYKNSEDKNIISNEEVFNILAKALTNEASKTHKPSKAALDATKAALASIKFKHGGILYAQNGTNTYDAQVFDKYKNRTYGGITNNNNNTTWYNNVFTPYSQHILDQLKAYNSNDTYGTWLNNMQTGHYKIYTGAGGTNWNPQIAYNDEADSVRNYQTVYNDDPYSKDKVAYGYNTRGITPAYNAGRYKEIGYTKRNGQDSLNTAYTPDGSYGGQTDDRRILGRLGDFTDQQLADWNTKLKAVGWEQYLDPTTNYYKLRRINPSIVDSSTKVNGANPDTMQKSHVLTDVLNGLKNHLPNITEAARVGWNNSFNNKQRDYQLAHLRPYLVEPYSFYRKIYGDYGTMSEYNRQSANTQNIANTIASNTADSSLAAATQLQGASKANDLAIKGRLADNQMIRDTYEKALTQNKENLQIANSVANTNRKNLNDNDRERTQVVLATNTMNHQNWDKFWQAQSLKAQHAQDERDAMQKYLDYATIMNNNSRTWDPQVKEITNKYRQQYLDATTDEERQVIADKMQEELTSLGYQKQDSLLNALAQLRGLNYSYTPIWKARVTIPSTATPSYKSKGGTIDYTRLATNAIKEKNKDIERMYKDWSKKDDRFFNQLGKLRQAKFNKIIKLK